MNQTITSLNLNPVTKQSKFQQQFELTGQGLWGRTCIFPPGCNKTGRCPCACTPSSGAPSAARNTETWQKRSSPAHEPLPITVLEQSTGWMFRMTLEVLVPLGPTFPPGLGPAATRNDSGINPSSSAASKSLMGFNMGPSKSQEDRDHLALE